MQNECVRQQVKRRGGSKIIFRSLVCDIILGSIPFHRRLCFCFDRKGEFGFCRRKTTASNLTTKRELEFLKTSGRRISIAAKCSAASLSLHCASNTSSPRTLSRAVREGAFDPSKKVSLVSSVSEENFIHIDLAFAIALSICHSPHHSCLLELTSWGEPCCFCCLFCLLLLFV